MLLIVQRPRSRRILIGGVLVFCLALAVSDAAPEPRGRHRIDATDPGARTVGAEVTAQRPGASLIAPLGRDTTNAAIGGGLLAYSNTGSNVFFAPGAGRRLADDIVITESCGCTLNRIEFTVSGGGDGSGPGFSVDYALYDACPNDGGQIIAGTSGSIIFLDDGLHVVTVASGSGLQIPASFWLALTFDTPSAGWFIGATPEVGFSNDVYDFPTFPCVGQVGAPLFASFLAQVFCEPVTAPNLESPNPANGAVGVPLTTVLTWNGGARAPSGPASREDERDFVTPETFECGTSHPDDGLAALNGAIASGEVPDPAPRAQRPVAPRMDLGGVAGFSAPVVTEGDIYVYEDSAGLLVTSFSDGALFNFMGQATAALLGEHGDNYDFVGFFLNFVPDHQIGGAFYLGLENHVMGIGLGDFNNRPNYGVPGDNVEGWVMMWNQETWPTGLMTYTQLVLGQEFEHRWGMFLWPLPDGRRMQGNDTSCGRWSHWNFRVDGQGSGMEIGEWVGSSPATRPGETLNFNSDIGGVFSYPDLYLMGYVDGDEMDSAASELRYLDDNTFCDSPYSGTISTWGSADVIAANGARSPSAFLAQKQFATAWIMIHQPVSQGGQLPTSAQLGRVVTILNNWSDQYEASTLGRGTMSNVLSAVNPCTATFDVRFGTQNPPTTLICQGLTTPACNPGTLETDTTYYWQVSGTNYVGSADGPVWSFSTGGTGPDCNNNGVPDATDIASGTSQDCNGNGIPDECDIADCAGDPACADCNGNGVPDGCEADCQPNGIPDECDISGGSSQDCQPNGIPDECEADCQPNGIPDDCDISGGASGDCDGNGVPDECDGDADGDGVPDACDICPGGDDAQDSDSDGVPDFCDVCPGGDDAADADGDGVPDFCDVCPGGDDTADADGDGVPDLCDICPGGDDNVDTDSDGVPDDCDNCPLANPDQADCQPNGIGDVCDIDSGTSSDGDGNGVPDECEVGPPLPEDSLGVPCNPGFCTLSEASCERDADCPLAGPPDNETCNTVCTNEAYCIAGSGGTWPGTCYVPKNRYLSVSPNPTNGVTARRVSLETGAGSVVLGWVGAPSAAGVSRIVSEANRYEVTWSTLGYPIWCSNDAQCPNADCGGLVPGECDTGTTNTIHIGDCHVSPTRTYLIQAIPAGAPLGDEGSYSPSLTLRTVEHWADVMGTTVDDLSLPPDGAANFGDILGIVKGFQGDGTAPDVWLDLVATEASDQKPDFVVGFADVLAGVRAFQNDPYGGDDPCTCAALKPCK